MVTQNVGGIDRVVRLAIGIVLLPIGVLVLAGGIGIVGIAVTTVGFIGLASGVTGFCPPYVLFGWSTAHKRTAAFGGVR